MEDDLKFVNAVAEESAAWIALASGISTQYYAKGNDGTTMKTIAAAADILLREWRKRRY